MTEPTNDLSVETPPVRDVHFDHSKHLGEFLEQIGVSVLISTYQAGKVVSLSGSEGQLSLSFHNFQRPMGLAVDAQADQLAVAALDKVWFLRNDRAVAASMDPTGARDACWLTRSAHVTGDIQAHELAWGSDGLWIVNTLFSCLCTLDTTHSFVPRWRPPFVSGLASEDRCHLNGLAMEQGKPKYVTVMAESDTAGGWRTQKRDGGCLIAVDSGEVVARGFAMPHSPKLHAGKILMLDSGHGSLVHVDAGTGEVRLVGKFPGYTRGLDVWRRWAFVGLSKIRETSTFSDIPIAEDRDRLKCGVAIVDLLTGQLEAQFEFKTGVEEIFDIALVPGKGNLAMRGPYATDDGDSTIWVVPRPSVAP